MRLPVFIDRREGPIRLVGPVWASECIECHWHHLYSTEALAKAGADLHCQSRRHRWNRWADALASGGLSLIFPRGRKP